VDDTQSPKLRKVERDVEGRLRELARSGELQGLPGQGEPLRDDDGGTDEDHQDIHGPPGDRSRRGPGASHSKAARRQIAQRDENAEHAVIGVARRCPRNDNAGQRGVA